MQAVVAAASPRRLPPHPRRGVIATVLGSRRAQLATMLAALAALGLVVHHGYLTRAPLASDDWTWVSSAWLRSLFPWPPVWDPTSGFGAPSFSRLYTAPFETLWGGFAQLGIDWNILEKLFYFIPFAVLSFVGPWLLARELLGSARWAVLAAVFFATNTHVLLRGTAHLSIACAFAVGTLVFWADIRAKRRGSASWAILTGLLLTLQATYDIRIAILAVWCLALKAVLEAATAGSWTARFRSMWLFGLPVLLFASTQLAWAIPFVISGGARLPIADAPVTPFANLGHGFTARDPLWTGAPVAFKAGDVPWLAYFTPLVAFLALTMRRIRLEYAWLLLCALIAAFLIKQDGAPAGALYGWLFAHVPTWNLFREATKLFWIPAVAYAVVVPYVACAAWRALRSRGHTGFALIAAALLIAYPLGDAAANAITVARGDLGGTTVATKMPDSFTQLRSLLASDPEHSSVAFIGGAAVSDVTIHRFSLASSLHPDLELWGTTHPFDPTALDNDPLNAFCPGGNVPFCYLQAGLFPYLLHELGVGYVVAPAGSAIGSLPWGTSYEQLTARLSSMLGAPSLHLGSGTEALSVWHLRTAGTTVVGSAAIARVAAPPSATASALPALAALGLPAIFEQGVRENELPDSIDVVTGLDRRYTVRTGGQYVLALPAGAAAPSHVSVNGRMLPVHALAASWRSDGQLLGPLDLPAGTSTVDAGVAAGALIAWSPTAAAAITSAAPESSVPSTDASERVTFAAPAAHWVVMRRAFDDQWRLAGSDIHLTADGMLNAYHINGSAASTTVAASYGSGVAEAVGLAASFLVPVALVTALVVTRWRRNRRSSRAGRSSAESGTITRLNAGRLSVWLGRVGISCVALAMGSRALQTIGWPSPHPGSAGDALVGGSPYTDASIYYLSIGMALLLLSIVARVAQRRVTTARARVEPR